MSKIEGLVNAKPEPIIKNKFKITAHYSSDRNKIMGRVLALDPNAEFKICDSWRFKVKTKLIAADLWRLLVKDDEISNIKRCWFF